MNFSKLNKNQKYKLKQVAVLTIAWVTIGNLLYFDLYGYMYRYGIEPDINLNLPQMLLGNSLAPLLAGIIGGSFMVFNLKPRTAKHSYLRNILNLIFLFTWVYMLVTWVAGLFYFSFGMGISFWEMDFSKTFGFLFDFEGVRNYFRWLLIISLSNLFLQIDDKFGPGILWAIIRGKYQKPVEEERIVMFLDLKNSTGIAEKLGGTRYHLFLRDFFNDVTQPVLKSNGMIYQYVGDEVVVVWEPADGSENANCIRCYFEVEEKIRLRRAYYEEEYGIVPEFKAGIHHGMVTIGEIGTIKRDISLSGDVLNTTSRIQEKCKEAHEKVVISGSLLNLIPAGLLDFIDLGSMQLKGKTRAMELAAIRGMA